MQICCMVIVVLWKVLAHKFWIASFCEYQADREAGKFNSSVLLLE